MSLIKTSILTAISTLIRVFTGFIINKFISIYIGPSGLAMVGHFRDFVAITSNIGNGAISQGVVKYIAQYREDIDMKSKILSTSLIISLASATIVGIILNIFSLDLSLYILKSERYKSIFQLFSFTIILFSLNTLLISILNGEKEIKKYITINIISSLFSLIFTTFLIIKFALFGSLFAMVFNLSIIFFITLTLVTKSKWYKFSYFIKGFDKSIGIKLGKYILMALVSAITVPLSQMLVRYYIANSLGWESGGYWQGIWYISSIYLMVVTTSLGVYYLPRLSEIKNPIELKMEILNGYKIILPIVIAVASTIYIFREDIIYIAFSEKFIPMLELFKWQLIGDVIKIASWLLSYIMLAKAMSKLYILSEIIFSSLFVILSILFIDRFGLIGVTYAFTLNYMLYFIIMALIFKKEIK